MKTQILLDRAAREKLLEGVTILADTVGMTLGARARNVAIAKGVPPDNEVYQRVVKDDGVEVAKSIELEDEFVQMGVALVREAAQKQVDEVGDGTTVTIILAHAIISEAEKQLSAGRSPMEIREELERELHNALKALKKQKITLKTYEDKVNIATISAKEPALGKLIADTFEKMGNDGIITVEESKSVDTFVEYQKGMQFDKGYVSPYFITDPSTMRADLENSYVLVTDLTVDNMIDLVPFLEEFLKRGERIITIISPNFGGTALPSFIQNKMEGKFLPLLVYSPEYGENQKSRLSDLAVMVGANYVTGDTGATLKDIKFEDLGRAKHISASKDTTIISGGAGKKADIDIRIDNLKKLMAEETDSDYKQEKYKERIAKLTSGVAVIKVGGQTEVEMQDRKEKVLDAVSATRHAIKTGIVAGGEIIYLHLRPHVTGILNMALKQPFYKLLSNSGIDLNDYDFNLKNPPKNAGIDVLSKKIVNMIEKGIIDPVAVSEQALRNAVSVAIQIILTGAISVPVKSEKKK